MNKQLPPFREILYDADEWSKTEKGTFLARVICDDGYDDVYELSVSQLEEQHPSFPECLEGLLYWKYQFNQENHVSGLQVAASLDLLQNGCFAFKNEQGRDRWFSTIRNVATKLEPEGVAIEGDWIITASAGIKSRVTFVTDIRRSTIRVSREHLNTSFPGWQERWEIGKELGVEVSVLVKHAFTKPIDQILKIDDVSFDN